MEPCKSVLLRAEERVFPKDIHGVLETGTGGLHRVHLYAPMISEQRAMVEAVQGLV